MNLNYIILVHKNPEQVGRLVRRLRSKNSFFYVHVDSKASIDPFRSLLSVNPNLRFVKKREDGKWGSLGIVKAVLRALQQILQDKRTGYCILLSGQDYPLKSNAEIVDFFANNHGCNFADTWAIPATRWYNGGLDRINHYKFDLNDGNRNYTVIPPLFTTDFRQNWRRNLNNIAQLLKQGKVPFPLLRKRCFPKYLKPYGGSQWFAITTEMAKDILGFIKKNKSYVTYHKYTLLADEIFFQSLIVHFSSLTKTPLKSSLTYVRWEGKEAAHPITFSIGHFNELKETIKFFPGKVFARKFNHGDNTVNLIDEFLKELDRCKRRP
jgi:hypothetical protein